MENKEVLIFNTPILTNFGVFRFEEITLKDVIRILTVTPYKSFVGHKETCSLLSRLIGRDIEYNREAASMEVGDCAIVFRLNTRIIGVELTELQISEIGYTFGFIERIR